MDLGGLMRYFANSRSLVLCEDNDETLIYVSGQLKRRKCKISRDGVIKVSDYFQTFAMKIVLNKLLNLVCK